MRNILPLIFVLGLIGCASQSLPVKGPPPSVIAPPPKNGTKMPVVHLYAVDDHMRRCMKSQGIENSEEAESSRWLMPLGVGKAQPLPEVQSVHHQKEIDLSRNFYNEGNFVEAAKVVQAALEDEPDNEFILECYARALYRMTKFKPISYEFYKRLISKLDMDKEGCIFSLDSWFLEAYWKYGTLLMDMGEWEKAAFEISRALAITFFLNEAPTFVPQAYSYLVEAYFNMARYDVAKYYADAALQIDSKNEYVKHYLARIEGNLP